MERILIVEDSATQREMLRHTLVVHGYDTVVASDGAEAWGRLSVLQPTIVVTDIVMPQMDGYALCRAMKQEPKFAAIPVVLLTSLSDPKDIVAALECGADGFVGKPFSDDYLLARIEAIIANRDRPQRERGEAGIEVNLDGRNSIITAGRRQILDLLLSVYDVAMRRNVQLAEAQAGLQKLNLELEQKVQDRTRRLEDSNKALEAFCYSVAHDLRAPLRGIQGYIGKLTEDYANAIDDTARDYAARACAAASRMDKLILDLLAYGRVSHADAPMQDCDLRVEIEQVIAERQEEIVARQARVSVDAPSIRLASSRVLLGQVLHNLVGNALKFARPDEAPQVEIQARPTPTGARIVVADRGIGIEPRFRAKIFNLFEKVHAGPFPGTGAGLAIARKAIERLGGQISVESELGQGTRFTVELSNR